MTDYIPPSSPLELLHEDDHLLISAGDGALRIRSVQPEGARAMTVPEFLNGTPLEVGDLLG